MKPLGCDDSRCGKNTCRWMSSRTSVYLPSRTTPTISIGVGVLARLAEERLGCVPQRPQFPRDVVGEDEDNGA
jgi:hypothetical protein